MAEEAAWVALCRRLDGFGHVFYRRRRKNENRKAGNIADFVRTWGAHYEGMLVLDFDLRLEGLSIVKDALFTGQKLRLSGVAFLWYRLHEPDGSLLLADAVRRMAKPVEMDLRAD